MSLQLRMRQICDVNCSVCGMSLTAEDFKQLRLEMQFDVALGYQLKMFDCCPACGFPAGFMSGEEVVFHKKALKYMNERFKGTLVKTPYGQGHIRWVTMRQVAVDYHGELKVYDIEKFQALFEKG